MKASLKVTDVDCVFWDGVNREPVYEALEPVLRGVIEKERESLLKYYPDAPHPMFEDSAWCELVRFTADEESGEKYDDYNMLKLWWCGGPEVSPGDWLVWFQDPRDGGEWTFEATGDVEFRAAYDLVTP